MSATAFAASSSKYRTSSKMTISLVGDTSGSYEYIEMRQCRGAFLLFDDATTEWFSACAKYTKDKQIVLCFMVA